MALIECPECGKQISNTVNRCPNCGFRIKKQTKKRRHINPLLKYITITILGIILVISLALVVVKLSSFVRHALAVKNDSEAPIVECDSTFNVDQYKELDMQKIVDYTSVTDNVTKDLKIKVENLTGNVDTSKAGFYFLTAEISDEAGNIGTKLITVKVVSKYSDEEITMLENGIRAYNALKDQLKNPDSLKILDMRYSDSTKVYSIKYSGTNSYGGTVTEYVIYYNGTLMKDDDAEMYSLMKSETKITYDELFDFSKSDYD